jgi:hypothetical protein
MLLSRDKLQEAEFFLAKVREARGRQPAFRYYLFATGVGRVEHQRQARGAETANGQSPRDSP